MGELDPQKQLWLNLVRELDAATLDQIRQACREQTEKLDETEANKDKENDDQELSAEPDDDVFGDLGRRFFNRAPARFGCG